MFAAPFTSTATLTRNSSSKSSPTVAAILQTTSSTVTPKLSADATPFLPVGVATPPAFAYIPCLTTQPVALRLSASSLPQTPKNTSPGLNIVVPLTSPVLKPLLSNLLTEKELVTLDEAIRTEEELEKQERELLLRKEQLLKQKQAMLALQNQNKNTSA